MSMSRAKVRRITGLLAMLALIIGFGTMVQDALALPNARAMPAAKSPEEGSLADILGNMGELSFGQENAMVTYANLARQSAALQVEPPADGSDLANAEGWIAAILPLALPQSTGRHWVTAEWRQTFGFDLYQVDQVVNYSEVPFDLTLLRGSFDPTELRAAWANLGYQPIDLDSGEAYAVRDDLQVDLSAPGSSMALANLNVVALANDGTLILGSTRDAVRQALAATNGLGPSFAERSDIAPLLQAAPPDLVSAVIVPGSIFRTSADPDAAIRGEDESRKALATRVAAEFTEAQRLPQIASVLLGQTEGSLPDRGQTPDMTTPAATQGGSSARLVAILSTMNPEAAEEGAAVITERLTTGSAPMVAAAELANRPWNELYSEWTVQAIAGEPALMIELAPAAGTPASLLQGLVLVRVPSFLAWAP